MRRHIIDISNTRLPKVFPYLNEDVKRHILYQTYLTPRVQSSSRRLTPGIKANSRVHSPELSRVQVNGAGFLGQISKQTRLTQSKRKRLGLKTERVVGSPVVFHRIT